MRKSNKADRCDAWYDGSAICVIAVGSHGDPLDLGEGEVVELITKLESCLNEERGDKAREADLEKEANEIQGLLVGKTLSRVLRPRVNELVLEFSDGTRLFVDTKSTPEFSIT